MSINVKNLVLACTLACLATWSSYGQQTSGSGNNSLGDVARALKAQKSKGSKPVKVITNDNLPAADRGQPEPSTASKDSNAKNSAASAPKDESKPPAPSHDEAYYRKQMSTLQDNLDLHNRELTVLQQKLGQNQTQYYSDPNKTLQQEYSRADLDKLTAEIDAKKGQIADDQKAIDDLHEQLRQEGGDPGWLR